MQYEYDSQTKILEVRTDLRERLFEVLFKGALPKLSTHPFEKGFEETFPNVGSTSKSSFGEHKCFVATRLIRQWIVTVDSL